MNTQRSSQPTLEFTSMGSKFERRERLQLAKFHHSPPDPRETELVTAQNLFSIEPQDGNGLRYNLGGEPIPYTYVGSGVRAVRIKIRAQAPKPHALPPGPTSLASIESPSRQDDLQFKKKIKRNPSKQYQLGREGRVLALADKYRNYWHKYEQKLKKQGFGVVSMQRSSQRIYCEFNPERTLEQFRNDNVGKMWQLGLRNETELSYQIYGTTERDFQQRVRNEEGEPASLKRMPTIRRLRKPELDQIKLSGRKAVRPARGHQPPPKREQLFAENWESWVSIKHSPILRTSYQ